MKNLRLFSVLIIGMVSMFATSCTRVDSGNEALKVDQFGNDKGTPVATEVKGTVFYNPFTQDVYEYPTYMQHAEYDELSFTTKDGSVFTAKPSFNYKMKVGRAVGVFTVYRKDMYDIESTYMWASVQDAYVRVGNRFTADSLMASRAKFEDQMIKELALKIGEDFDISQLVSNMTPPASLVEAINNKNKLVQEGLAEQNKVVKAEAAAKVRMADAYGDSASAVTRAAGDAKAYELQQRNLTPMLIDKMRIEKWDGSYPSTMLGGNTSTLLNIK